MAVEIEHFFIHFPNFSSDDDSNLMRKKGNKIKSNIQHRLN